MRLEYEPLLGSAAHFCEVAVLHRRPVRFWRVLDTRLGGKSGESAFDIFSLVAWRVAPRRLLHWGYTLNPQLMGAIPLTLN